MLTAIIVRDQTGNGRYRDILDVCEHLGREKYENATNALIVLAKGNPEFKATLKRIRKKCREQGSEVETML
jgi:hypothetical protein